MALTNADAVPSACHYERRHRVLRAGSLASSIYDVHLLGTSREAKGMPIVETDDGWSWEPSNVVVPSEQKQSEFNRECHTKTFAKG